MLDIVCSLGLPVAFSDVSIWDVLTGRLPRNRHIVGKDSVDAVVRWPDQDNIAMRHSRV